MADMADTGAMIVETFKKFDLNGDGMISRDELKRVLCCISTDQFDDSAVDALLAAADKNKDGFVQYEEFVCWVTADMKDNPVEFKPLDQRGDFQIDYRKLLPERFAVDVAKRYDLDRAEIGAGGFGQVFIARDKEFSDRKVAVKKTRKPARTSSSEPSDLEKEIEVMKELDHPNICKLLATFEEGRNLYFIMELCEGGELFDRIIENGFVSERTTSIILVQVCSALSYAHGRGIAHRDIKPENVVFCTKDRDDTRIKLIDWGLATNFEGGMTKAVGSMTYAAPEVISSQDRKAYSEACDLWSVGVLTYVMLCGKPPFWGTREQHYKAARAERYPFRDDPWDRMNPDAKDFVKNLLKASPAARTPIGQAAKHPWLLSAPTEGSTENTGAVLSNLKNFAGQSTFSRLCITAVARQLDHAHLKDIHKVFREMDTDGNGVLSVEEVTTALRKLNGDTGAQMDLKDVEELFKKLDADGSKTIDYTEFCAAGLGQKTSSQDDVIWAAFKTFDLDNSGWISVENLKTILDSADVKDVWSANVCEEVGQEIIQKFDTNGDGRITFEEWQQLMTGCWSKTKTETTDVVKSVSAYDLLAQVSGLDMSTLAK